MRRVLITGSNSYIGTNLEKWLTKEPNNYIVETLDMKNPSWINFDFSNFDVVFHVAGIAHVSTKKSMKDLYFKVNRDLAIQTAVKAKESGVKQFIFMSSMIVYNSKETKITRDTKPNPDNFYGLSKLQAEENISLMQSDDFNVAVLRPPMIYGPNSKGNFRKLIKLAKIAFLFPNYSNKRSFLFIDNLCLSLLEIINNQMFGVFFPQNNELFSTHNIIRMIREIMGKKILFTKMFNPIIRLMIYRNSNFTKLFGDYYYEINESKMKQDISIKESIKMTLERI